MKGLENQIIVKSLGMKPNGLLISRLGTGKFKEG